MRISLGWTMACCWENFIVSNGHRRGWGGHRCGWLGRDGFGRGGLGCILSHGARHGGADGQESGSGDQVSHSAFSGTWLAPMSASTL